MHWLDSSSLPEQAIHLHLYLLDKQYLLFLDRLDWFVQNCSQRGMYVILDMHGAFGSQNGMDHSGEINDGKQLYYNQSNKDKTLNLWIAL